MIDEFLNSLEIFERLKPNSTKIERSRMTLKT